MASFQDPRAEVQKPRESSPVKPDKPGKPVQRVKPASPRKDKPVVVQISDWASI